MTTERWTKGPWTAGMSKYWDGVMVVQAGMPTNRVLARFGSDDEPLDEIDEANARLIAAAPDLADACDFALTILEGMGNGNGGAAEACRAALKKARGEA